MSFYRDEINRDTLWAGLDAPRSSKASLLLALARLEDLTIEEKTERKNNLDALFDKLVAEKCEGAANV